MKFDVTIKDISLEEFNALFNQTTVEGIEIPTELLEADAADSEGLVWDERIHSSNKKKKADGTWVRRRGVTDEEYETIKIVS